MIIGSGLLAKAFTSGYEDRDDVCIYAAGVSNSGCTDANEFYREKVRLQQAIASSKKETVFVYFSTCSIYDEDLLYSPYVRHKLAMESLVVNKPNHLIFRLPQVVGKTPNPHTLLNFLYARITRSEKFYIWKNAQRNVIDVDDVASISDVFINDQAVRDVIVNIANPENYSVLDVVRMFESVLHKKAICDYEDKGNEYVIDVCQMQSVVYRSGVVFNESYLNKIISKYYANK
jgi:nucleoside-diphosphate-sugar epimerase